MKKEIILILHNIRSVYNVGAIFRTADAVGVKKIYLTGYTPTPLDRFGRKRPDVAKSALGAEEAVYWEQEEDLGKLILELKEDNFEIIALEQDSRSQDYRKVKIKEKIALLVGNETEGLQQSLVDASDVVIEIPMRGKKESLNVSVAAGVVRLGGHARGRDHHRLGAWGVSSAESGPGQRQPSDTAVRTVAGGRRWGVRVHPRGIFQGAPESALSFSI